MPNEEYLNESLRKIAKGAGITFVGTAIGMFFGFLTRTVIARFLGPGDYGLISLGVAALSIATTLSLIGLRTGVTRYISFYKGKKDEGGIKGTIVSALKISFPISLTFAFLLFFGSGWISVNVFHDESLTPILKIFSIAVPFFALSQILLRASIGFQDVRYQVYVENIFQGIFKFAAIILLIYLGFGVLGAAWGWALTFVIMPFLAFYFLEKRVFPVFNSKVKAIPIGKELLLFSLPLIFVTVSRLIMGWTDTIMLGYFCTSYDVGIYNAALPTAQLIEIALASFGMIFMPVVSELYAKGSYEDLRKTYSTVTKWIISIVFPAFLLMALFSEKIIEIIFGSGYISGATALTILAFGYFIASIVALSIHILVASGRTKTIMWCISIGAIINIFLNAYLVPIYGINGAAIATTASMLLINLSYFVSMYHTEKMQPFRMSFFKSILASALACLLVYAVTKYLIGDSLFVLIAMFFVFLIVYFFLLLIFKSFEEDDLMIMRAIDERLGTKSDWVRAIIRKFL